MAEPGTDGAKKPEWRGGERAYLRFGKKGDKRGFKYKQQWCYRCNTIHDYHEEGVEPT